MRKRIHPKWDRVRLANVPHGDIQAWVTELAPGHSPATVQKVHRVLSLVLDPAVKNGRLVRNVATGYPGDVSKFSSMETRTNETYRLVVLFVAYTGVRFGEMASLRVARIDLRRNRAVIAESVTPVQGLDLVWGTTKTHQRREVPIPRFLVTELAEHVRDKRVDHVVFAGIRTGQPLRVSTFRTAFGAASRAIACPAFTRTSCGIPRQASRSPAAPTSRSSNRCWGTAQRR